MCPSNDTFNKNKKISMLVLGLHSKDRKFTRDKANISNPKVNRGCPPLAANHTSADCVQISLGPSMQYIPLRVYHTGGFNAMSKRGPPQQDGHTLNSQKSWIDISYPVLTVELWGVSCDCLYSNEFSLDMFLSPVFSRWNSRIYVCVYILMSFL